MSCKKILIFNLYTIFFITAIINLSSFLFVSFPTRWWNLLFFIIYGFFGLIVFAKWKKIAYWQKWVVVFIGLQIAIALGLPYLINFMYYYKIGLVRPPASIEHILWQVHNKVTYPSYLFRSIAFDSATITDGGKAKAVINLRWSILASILDLIYAGIIGIIVGYIVKRIRGQRPFPRR